jgi:hypothetical protein
MFLLNLPDLLIVRVCRLPQASIHIGIHHKVPPKYTFCNDKTEQ